MQKTPSRATISEETFISIVIKDKKGQKILGQNYSPSPTLTGGVRVELRLRFFRACARACRISGLNSSRNNSSALRCPELGEGVVVGGLWGLGRRFEG